MPLTAFGVLISTSSPGRMRDLSTATEIRPLTTSIVDKPGTSVSVTTERSRTVTMALPPSSIRANAWSPVATRSLRNTSSLNFSGVGDAATRVTVTGPTTVVATPTRSCAAAGITSVSAESRLSSPVVSFAVIGAPRTSTQSTSRATPLQPGCQTIGVRDMAGLAASAERKGLADGQRLISPCHDAATNRCIGAGRGRLSPMPRKEPPAPKRVLSIHAHPDDQEFTVAGTLAKWARAGSEIVTVCLTRGAAGSNKSTPADMTRERLAKSREEEQRAACRVLGISEVVFLGYEDGVLTPSIDMRRDLTRLIRRHRPDAVVTGDPTVRYYGTRYMNHPDHRVAGDVALDAVFPSAETRFIFPELLDEGLTPHRVSAVWLFGSDRAETFVDISATLELKVRALREHRTQMGDWDPEPMIAGWARDQGARRRLRAAESFLRMVLGD